MKYCYIFHVIGTLNMLHVALAMESLKRQEEFHWDRFVLYNGSDLPTDGIMQFVPAWLFNTVEVFPYQKSTPKSCSADWREQMKNINGADRYFCHKADFYLPPGTIRAFEKIKQKDFIVLFNKWDMKGRATIEDIRRYATLPWAKGLKEPDCGTYWDHLGKMAIPYAQPKGLADGTMHGYSDSVRREWKPSHEEYTKKWGVALSFRELEYRLPKWFVRDPKFFACHMWHNSPDRNDWNKSLSPEECF